MTVNEIKERLRAVLSTLDGMPVSGIRNVQNMAGCMSILMDIINAPEVQEAAEGK